MVKMNNKENYMAIATPYEDPNIKISIAYKGEKNLQNNLFLIIKYCPRDNPGSVLQHTGMRPRFVFCFVVRLTVQNEGVPWLHTLA